MQIHDENKFLNRYADGVLQKNDLNLMGDDLHNNVQYIHIITFNRKCEWSRKKRRQKTELT